MASGSINVQWWFRLKVPRKDQLFTLTWQLWTKKFLQKRVWKFRAAASWQQVFGLKTTTSITWLDGYGQKTSRCSEPWIPNVRHSPGDMKDFTKNLSEASFADKDPEVLRTDRYRNCKLNADMRRTVSQLVMIQCCHVCSHLKFHYHQCHARRWRPTAQAFWSKLLLCRQLMNRWGQTVKDVKSVTSKTWTSGDKQQPSHSSHRDIRTRPMLTAIQLVWMSNARQWQEFLCQRRLCTLHYAILFVFGNQGVGKDLCQASSGPQLETKPEMSWNVKCPILGLNLLSRPKHAISYVMESWGHGQEVKLTVRVSTLVHAECWNELEREGRLCSHGQYGRWGERSGLGFTNK